MIKTMIINCKTKTLKIKTYHKIRSWAADQVNVQLWERGDNNISSFVWRQIMGNIQERIEDEIERL